MIVIATIEPRDSTAAVAEKSDKSMVAIYSNYEQETRTYVRVRNECLSEQVPV